MSMSQCRSEYTLLHWYLDGLTIDSVSAEETGSRWRTTDSVYAEEQGLDGLTIE